ncbi:hypothetical protein Lalb_Chr01g0001811 [Lupinus albus]|uniref:Uncharacterized protein n=1 Tax=Lupinus albus TaxID=3870 RepID=A0A6A4QZT9_LUPAL|nr:hypothetical protein Lalb_Chr01g0001811 [Lupinus albus]
MVAYRSKLLFCEVEDASFFSELRSVPVVMSREDRGFGFRIDTKDICF